MALVSTDLKDVLPMVAHGKVRDLYQVSEATLLFVATDRISAYDVSMVNGIPNKGKILTQMSKFWFDKLKPITKTHLVEGELFEALPKQVNEDENLKSQLMDRSLLVRKYKILPLEVIVRGYITGSAWSEYQKTGTVHGVQMRPGMQESEAFDEPLYTPSTKAAAGEHDENITRERAAEIVGPDLAQRVEKLALDLYKSARDYALERGIIIADTKFEFGIDEGNQLVLVDEVLTPDSSRFWRKDTYKVGQTQDSYDKQFLRNWLTENKLKGIEGTSMPEDIVTMTKQKYVEAYEQLTGAQWND